MLPLTKLTNKQVKLKSKPWINDDIKLNIIKRYKIVHKYLKCKDRNSKNRLYSECKVIRNSVIKLKRDGKLTYFKEVLRKIKQTCPQYAKV